MEHTFDTPSPLELYVDLDRGNLSITASDTGQSSIRVEGDQPERLVVTHRDGRLSAVVERRSLFDFAPRLQVWVSVPRGTTVVAKTGSAEVAVAGPLDEVAVTTGSGGVEIAEADGLVRVQTGSGDVRIGSAGKARVKTGSGDITVGLTGEIAVQTGSGDIDLGTALGDATLKTASGHIRVDRADTGLVATTASGNIDLRRVQSGEISATSASGSIAVGVTSGIPVWTDVSTVTGRLASDLVGAGRPEPGQDHIRVWARTVSGDVRLVQLAAADLR